MLSLGSVRQRYSSVSFDEQDDSDIEDDIMGGYVELTPQSRPATDATLLRRL
jgi:hypothetical protein